MTKSAFKHIQINRILVALDPSMHSNAALEAAVTIAKALQAELHGLFVQEDTWQQLRKLSFLFEVNELTGDITPLAKERLEQQILVLESRLRRRFEAFARYYGVAYLWNTAEGAVEEKVLGAAKNADLITIGSKGLSYAGQKKFGRSANAVIKKADKPVLILHKGHQLKRTVIAVYDGSDKSFAGLRLALTLAEKNSTKLVILTFGNAAGKSADRDERLKELLETSRIQTELHLLETNHIREFLNIVNRQFGGLLVLPKNHPFLEKYSIDVFMEHLNNPILLI